MEKIFCRTIPVSVAAVADLRAGEGMEGMDQTRSTAESEVRPSKSVRARSGRTGSCRR